MFESDHHSSAATPLSKEGRKPLKAGKKDAVDPLYSPKKVAAAIGVSESSLKRWCDAGVVKAVKTPGGHRKITRAEVISFVKTKNYRLRKPHSIGLPDINSVGFSSIDQARASFLTAMINADAISSQKILYSLFIQGHNVAEIFDLVVSPAYLEIGAKRKRGELPVNHEQRAAEICHEALLKLKTIIPQVSPNSPVAIGVSLGENEFRLATLGAELCLRNSGWSVTLLGASGPINSLLEAVAELQPSVIVVSVGLIDDQTSFIAKLKELSESVSALAKTVVITVGAEVIEGEIRKQIPTASCCQNFAQLVLISVSASAG